MPFIIKKGVVYGGSGDGVRYNEVSILSEDVDSLKYILVSDGMGSTVVKGSDYEEGTKIKFAVPVGGGTRRVKKETENIDTGENIIEFYDLNYPASDAGKEIIVSTDAYTTNTFESGFTVYVSRPTTNYLKEEINKLSEDIADLKENGTGGGTVITSPKLAEVGNFLAVKEVDENGKPIEWEYVVQKNELPTATQEDEGKFLQVVNGKWTAVSVTNGNEVAY